MKNFNLSVVIPNYNNTKYLLQNLNQLKDVKIVNEIIIVDDTSNDFVDLSNLIAELNDNRIKLYKNEFNLGALKNKLKSLEYCTNEWAVLFDSDNYFSENFFDIVQNLELDSNKIYSPCLLHKIDENNNSWGGHNNIFDYREFNNISKENFHSLSSNMNFRTLMNTCNYLLPVKNFMSCISIEVENYDTRKISSIDCVMFFSHWIQCGYSVEVVPELEYKHRIHSNSQYMANIHLLNPDEWYSNLINVVK